MKLCDKWKTIFREYFLVVDCQDWKDAWSGLTQVSVLSCCFSIFSLMSWMAEKRGCLLNLQTTPCSKCRKDAGEQGREFKSILTNWKNYGNTVFFVEFNVHFPIC